MRSPIAQFTPLHENICHKLAQQGLGIAPNSVINRNLLFNGPVHFYSNCEITRVQIDAYSYVNNHSTIRTTKIGRYCSIGSYVDIGMSYHDYKRPATTSSFYQGSIFENYLGAQLPFADPYAIEHQGSITSEPIIGNDVWIGSHVKIPGNVTIGHGAVIGTNAVITRDVPPYAIIQTSSNNSKLKDRALKYRFSEKIINELLSLNWWDYDIPRMLASGIKVPITKIEDFISFFKNEDVSTFLTLKEDWRLLAVLNSDHVSLTPAYKDMFFDFSYIEIPD